MARDRYDLLLLIKIVKLKLTIFDIVLAKTFLRATDQLCVVTCDLQTLSLTINTDLNCYFVLQSTHFKFVTHTHSLVYMLEFFNTISAHLTLTIKAYNQKTSISLGWVTTKDIPETILLMEENRDLYLSTLIMSCKYGSSFTIF